MLIMPPELRNFAIEAEAVLTDIEHFQVVQVARVGAVVPCVHQVLSNPNLFDCLEFCQL